MFVIKRRQRGDDTHRGKKQHKDRDWSNAATRILQPPEAGRDKDKFSLTASTGRMVLPGP